MYFGTRSTCAFQTPHPLQVEAIMQHGPLKFQFKASCKLLYAVTLVPPFSKPCKPALLNDRASNLDLFSAKEICQRRERGC